MFKMTLVALAALAAPLSAQSHTITQPVDVSGPSAAFYSYTVEEISVPLVPGVIVGVTWSLVATYNVDVSVTNVLPASHGPEWFQFVRFRMAAFSGDAPYANWLNAYSLVQYTLNTPMLVLHPSHWGWQTGDNRRSAGGCLMSRSPTQIHAPAVGHPRASPRPFPLTPTSADPRD